MSILKSTELKKRTTTKVYTYIQEIIPPKLPSFLKNSKIQKFHTIVLEEKKITCKQTQQTADFSNIFLSRNAPWPVTDFY